MEYVNNLYHAVLMQPIFSLKVSSFLLLKMLHEISNAVKLLNTFKSHFPDRIESFELMPKTFWEVASNNIEDKKL